MSIVIHGVSMPKNGESLIIYSDGDVRGFLGCEPGTVGTAIELPPHAEIMDYDRLIPDSEWSDYEDGFTAYSINAIRAACILAEEDV